MGFFASLGQDTYDRTYSDGYLLRRLATYFSHERRTLAVIGVLLLCFAFLGLAGPLLVSGVVTELEATAPDSVINLLLAALLFTAVVDYALRWLRTRLTTRLVGQGVAELRKDAFRAAMARDLAFYDDNKSGKVVSRITSDTQELGGILVIFSDIFIQFVELAILALVLLDRSWQLTVLLILWMPIFTAIALLFRWLARRASRQGARAMAAVNDNIQESVSGIAVAKNFRREAQIYQEFSEINRLSYNINLRRGFVFALIFPVLNGITGLGIASLVYFGAQSVLAGAITAGSWYLFLRSVDRFWFPIINLAGFWSQLQSGLSATERIFALVDAENTVRQQDHQPVAHLTGAISFRDVTFEYRPGITVLDRFNLRIRPGESVAFVGHTGAGKSTIAKLIARFYEFQAGEIAIDGRDIRSLDIGQYRRCLGIVSQQPFLFSGTIAENIRYGHPAATDAELDQLARAVGGGEWLETLPEGLQTQVGERGSYLSMGQRQLVSLLRVLLQRPAIFILDEATASVDPFTELQIQEALDMILAQSTAIVIAHRLSTVRRADRIIVLSEGRIIEEGSHTALMAAGGHYADLYNTYFRHQSLSYVETARDTLIAQPQATATD